MTLEIGDTVAYTAAFVRSIGGGTFGIAERRGEVVARHQDRPFVYVRWTDDRQNTQLVNEANLAKPGSLRFGDCHA